MEIEIHDGTKVRCERVATMVSRGGYSAAESDAAIRRLREQNPGQQLDHKVRKLQSEKRLTYTEAWEMVKRDPANATLLAAYAFGRRG